MTSPALQHSKKIADFRPFRAWRYHPGKVSIGDVIAPPYDVISPGEQKALYARSDLNCIRLILNLPEPSDHDQANRYTRARDVYEQWKRSGVLIQEPKPCFYYYQQTFSHPLTGQPLKRTALFGRIRLEPFENRVVIPHEKTLAKARADRKCLLEATHTNFSPVFGLYEHDHGQTPAIQAKILSRPALYDAADDRQVRHQLWPIDDPSIQEGIQKAINAQRIYIADGHHRYTVSLQHAQAQRKLLGVPDSVELDSDFTLMALVHFYDPGMVIYPTHRMILPFDSFDAGRMMESLKAYFDLTLMPSRAVLQELRNNHTSMTFGVQFAAGGSYLLRLKDRAQAKMKMPSGHAEAWYDLDVAVVSYLILAKLWELPESEWEAKIRYTHDDEEALKAVENKQAAASFFVKAPKAEILRTMGDAEELMPQKSTYFYPKLISGFLFNQHET